MRVIAATKKPSLMSRLMGGAALGRPREDDETPGADANAGGDDAEFTEEQLNALIATERTEAAAEATATATAAATTAANTRWHTVMSDAIVGPAASAASEFLVDTNMTADAVVAKLGKLGYCAAATPGPRGAAPANNPAQMREQLETDKTLNVDTGKGGGSGRERSNDGGKVSSFAAKREARNKAALAKGGRQVNVVDAR